MADALVESLLNKLKDLLVNHGHLIREITNELETLEMSLRMFRAFLKDSVKTRRKDEHIKILVQSIHDVVYEAEDIIDEFVIQAIEKRVNTSFVNRFLMISFDLHTNNKMGEISSKAAEISTQVARSKIHFASPDLAKGDDAYENYFERHEICPPRMNDVVGFEDETAELKQWLITETEYFDVISVVGMSGLQGKTTLASKIFSDPDIMSKFPVRIWVTVSQKFSNKDVYLTIIEKFMALDKELHQKDEHELSQIAAGLLQSQKFLIVMDDVWKTSDWDILRKALPSKNNKKGNKVLITSPKKDVCRDPSKPRDPHTMRFLNFTESWELLCGLEALNKKRPSELEDVGKRIARECGGSPTRRWWEKVLTRMDNNANDASGDVMKKYILLSYDTLPYHLRACFLYLGMFPKDYEIPVSKLICMWIAEGFIQHDTGHRSLEETAERYLDDLINRSLVFAAKFNQEGKVKTCRIHDTLHDFCTSEAANEKEIFFQEIKFHNGVFAPPISDLNKFRRLSIHSYCLKFISSNPIGPRVRSLICFPHDESTLQPEYTSAILDGFKLLRVLDVKHIKFTKLPRYMFQLVHLRYIVMSVNNLSVLPAKLNQLWNIETLIIDTTSRTLDVKADLWKMNQLRHFKTNASATLTKPGINSRHGEEVQTLGMLSVESCTPEHFDRACNLKKLGIRGNLALFFEGKVGSFDSLERLRKLEKLKLINDVYPRPHWYVKLSGFPQPYLFPPGLRSLTLYSTYLKWDKDMSALGLLENLEVLKLKDKAFKGHTWKALDGGFRHLEFLHIEDTDLAEWSASSHHFPRLKGLVLRSCVILSAIPHEFAIIPSFQMLDVFNCRSAAVSARDIQKAKENRQAKGGAIFKLSISNPFE